MLSRYISRDNNSSFKISAWVKVLFIIGCFSAFEGCSRAPTDAQIASRFSTDRQVLTELSNKLSHEPLKIVGVTRDRVMVGYPYNWVVPADAGFSADHFKEYELLLRKVKISKMWRSDGETCFYITGFGFAGEGWRLLYVYTAVTPNVLVNSIDVEREDHTSHSNVMYRPLGSNWYIKLIQ
jgi:hypothetical protein